MQSDAQFLKRALKLAEKAAAIDEVPIGAVIVENGQIIAEAHNLKESTLNPVGHAECLVIQEAAKNKGNWRLVGCDLFVTLEPCPMCLAACQQARIKRVIYAAKDSKGGAISLGYNLNEDTRLNHRFEVVYISDAECEEILSNFFSNKRKKQNGT